MLPQCSKIALALYVLLSGAPSFPPDGSIEGRWRSHDLELELTAVGGHVQGSYRETSTGEAHAFGGVLTATHLAGSALLVERQAETAAPATRLVTLSAVLDPQDPDLLRATTYTVSWTQGDAAQEKDPAVPSVSSLTLRRVPREVRLELTVEEIRADQGGTFRGFLHASASTFPMSFDQAAYVSSTAIRGETLRLVFENVAPGDYAFVGYHDKNDNGKLDRGLFRPKEGIATTAASRSGRPSFKDALVRLEPGTVKLSTGMRYP